MADENKLSEEQINEAMFVSLVLSLNTAAMCQLGKMADPFTGKQERDLARAKGSIDMLRMLKAKSAGNLAEKEQQLLEQSITNLQMNYIEELKKDAAAPSKAAKGSDAAKGRSGETPRQSSGRAAKDKPKAGPAKQAAKKKPKKG